MFATSAAPSASTAASPARPAGRIEWPLHRRLRLRAGFWGLVAAVGLVFIYAGTLSLANSLDHAVSEFGRLWYWMVPLIIGFAVQAGLFAYARGATRGKSPAGTKGMVATGSTSSLSMVICCAHHLTDVLPLLGLAGAALFLSTYQSAFLLVGVISNVIGVVYMLGLLSKHRLFPSQRSALSSVLRWPIERSLRFVVAGSAIALVVVIAMEVL